VLVYLEKLTGMRLKTLQTFIKQIFFQGTNSTIIFEKRFLRVSRARKTMV